MKKINMFWQVYLNLEEELLNLSKYIYFTDVNVKVDKNTKQITEENSNQIYTYSSTIADLLVRCCIEIEALSKELYFDNGGAKARGSKDIYFDTDCIVLLNKKWNLDDKQVIVSAVNFDFHKDENKILRPLRNAGKSSTVYWAKAYQAVKHDRYNNMYMGNVRALLQAMAALYILNIYYRDEKITLKFSDCLGYDMSFGSKIFSLQKPEQTYVMAVINGNENMDIMHSRYSPYILKYTDGQYNELKEIVHQSHDEMNKYFFAQPELQEEAFIHQLNESIEKEKIDDRHRTMHFCELCKYRMNKKYPSSLPFDERKTLFVNGEERQKHIEKKRSFLMENEITEETIDKEIDFIATMAGFDMYNSFEYKKFQVGINSGYCELVLDKGDVKYTL